MISNQILQTNIEGLKGITRVDLSICDTEGKVLASTFTGAEEYESAILTFVDSPADSQVIQGYQFFKVFDEHQLESVSYTHLDVYKRQAIMRIREAAMGSRRPEAAEASVISI